MALPEPLRRFWYALEGLAAHCDRAHWGAVVSDARYPAVWDANKVVVLERRPDLRFAELAAAMPDVGYEHIEFFDLSDRCPALGELGDPPSVDVVMVARASRPDPGGAIEVAMLDETYWDAYTAIARRLGGIDEDTLTQLVARDRDVFVRAGMRMFAVYVDRVLAGGASLLSLDGVGYVDNVRTTPAYRRRGVAADATRAVMRASAEAGDEWCMLVADEDGDARRIYERLGFSAVSRVAAFHRGP